MKRIIIFISAIQFIVCHGFSQEDNQHTIAVDTVVYDSLQVERYLNDAEMYFLNERLDSALLKADSAIFISALLGNDLLNYESNILKGNILEKHPKKSAQAEENYLTAISIAQFLKRPDLTTNAMDCLFNYYNDKKSFEKALSIYKERAGLLYQIDKELADAAIQQLNDSISKVNAELKSTQKTLMIQRDLRSMFQMFFYVAAAIVLLLLIVLIVILSRNAKKRRQLQQEGNQSLEQEKINTLDKEKVLAKQTKELSRNEQEIGKLRYLIGEQLKYQDAVTKSMNEGLADILSESRLQLELIGRDPSGKLAVDKYMALQNLLTKASNETRELTGNIFTVKGTISERIESLCNSFLRPNFKTDFINKTTNVQLNSLEQTALLNVLSEIFLNIEKHSEATEVTVTLSDSEGKLKLQVDENGRGFDVKSSLTKGTGLRRIISIVTYLNGDLDIVSDTKKGTHYVLKL